MEHFSNTVFESLHWFFCMAGCWGWWATAHFFIFPAESDFSQLLRPGGFFYGPPQATHFTHAFYKFVLRVCQHFLKVGQLSSKRSGLIFHDFSRKVLKTALAKPGGFFYCFYQAPTIFVGCPHAWGRAGQLYLQGSSPVSFTPLLPVCPIFVWEITSCFFSRSGDFF